MRLAVAGAALTPASGCLGGSGETGNESDMDGKESGGSGAELAEFGYETWVPASGYRRIAYADLAGLRDWTTLETDDQTATVAGGVGPTFADADGYISTDAEDAYSGSFDAESLASGVADALSDTEEAEHKGYTVVRGTEGDGATVEVVLSDSFAVSSSQGEGGATRYVDAALGEAERAFDASQVIRDISEYAEDPLLVVFTPGGIGVDYRFIEETEGRLDFVEVTLSLPNSEEARMDFLNRTSPRRKYNESTLLPKERNTTARIQNGAGIVSSPTDDVDKYLRRHF